MKHDDHSDFVLDALINQGAIFGMLFAVSVSLTILARLAGAVLFSVLFAIVSLVMLVGACRALWKLLRRYLYLKERGH